LTSGTRIDEEILIYSADSSQSVLGLTRQITEWENWFSSQS